MKHISLLSLVLFSYLHLHADEKLIRAIIIHNNRITVYAHKDLEKSYLREPFFAQYAHDVNLKNLLSSISIIPFLMNIAPLVWHSGNRYTVPEMDEDLFYALAEIKEIFHAFFSANNWSGSIVPEKLIKNTPLPKCDIFAATLFSGGVDSLYTVLHTSLPQLLVTVQGGDIPLREYAMWNNVIQQNKAFAAQHGHEMSTVISNFGSFVNAKKTAFLLPNTRNWWSATSQSLAYTGLIAPLAYTYGCDHVLIGSSHTIEYPFPRGTHPIIDNSIRYAGIRVKHVGSDKTRMEKLQGIKNICKEQNKCVPIVRVCWGHHAEGGNCLKCEKCVRTAMELLLLNEKPDEYGFPIPIQQAIARAKILLTNKNEHPLTYSFWLCMNTYGHTISNISGPYSYSPEILVWLDWLQQQNLALKVRNDGGYYTDQETHAYATLWNKSLDNSFIITDIQSIPKRR